MANEKRLKVIDYDAVRDAFEEEYKKTRKLIESGETHLDNLAEGFTEADMVLRKIFNVDAVEVVLCKDCRYWENGDCYRLELSRQDDFCSYGERRQEKTYD